MRKFERGKKSNTLGETAVYMKELRDVLIFSHISPDGDTIGSMLALGEALESLGSRVLYYNGDPLPDYLAFLPGSEKINRTLPSALPDTFIFVDCTDAERAGAFCTETFLTGKNVMNIDHHISNSYFGDKNLVHVKAAAAGEVIYSLLRAMRIPFTKEIAVNIYTAIVTDTGRFSFSNTTEHCFRIAAHLLTKKINLVEINNILFENKSYVQVMLLKRALTNLVLYDQGRIAVITLRLSDFDDVGALEYQSEGLVNYARNICGVEIAALLKEISAGTMKVSLRSAGDFDVNQIAQKFQGGGHKKAAGFSVHLPWEQAKAEVLLALEEGLRFERSY